MTDVPAYWLFPTPATLAQPFQRIRDIDLRSASKKRKLQETTDTVAAAIPAPAAAGSSSSLESCAAFFAALNTALPSAAVLSLTDGYGKNVVPKTVTGQLSRLIV